MKEEIKDILKLLRDGVKRPVVTLSKYSLDNICELNPNECKKLLEYIENLQSQLKAKEEVIDKAIEYIQKMFETGFYNDDYYLWKLKKILQDKEVE